MEQFEVNNRNDIRKLHLLNDCNSIRIDARQLKFDGLLPVTLRRAFAATRLGGTITVLDDGRARAEAPAYDMTFNQVRQAILKFLGGGCEIVELSENGRITMRRVQGALPLGWGAGILYSGEPAEVSQIEKCLDALRAQPELAKADAEIIIAGPSRGERGFLKRYPGVSYFEIDGTEDAFGRFLLSAKKNALMDRMTAPRMLVLHSRIILDPCALSRAPHEFDMLSPNVMHLRTDGTKEPYMSLAQIDRPWPGHVLHRKTKMLRDAGGADPLNLHSAGPCYIDGGAMLIARPVFEKVRLDPRLGWAEGEDVDWCMRAFHAGFVPDLAENVRALSATSKWASHGLPATIERWGRKASDVAQKARGRFRQIAFSSRC